MTESERAEVTGRALLLYDGVCALCNGVVRFLLARDTRERMRFAPLKSGLGREILSRLKLHTPPDGVLLITDVFGPREQIFARSDAVAAALETLGAGWRIAGRLLLCVPRRLREFGYGLIARMRYRLFGRYAACPLPPPSLRRRLLGSMAE